MKRGLALLGVALLATACGYTPNMQEIEGQIRDGLKTNQINATVDCPNDIDWNTGNDFHCIATDKQGQTARITVTMETGDGDYTWAVD